MSVNYDKLKINADDILKYTFYDDSNKLVAIIDAEKLKEIFKVDIVEFNEKYRIDYIS